MFFLIKFAVLIVSLTDTVFADSNQNEPRIIHGSLAQLGQLPYQVSLQYQQNSLAFCGGSIVNVNHVVTAAHCFRNIKKKVKINVWAGSVTLQNGGVYKPVKNIFIHEKYNDSNQDYDIAVLRLKTPFIFNNVINSIALPSSNISDETDCIVSGWGDTQPKLKSFPKNLLFAHVKIVNWKYCSMKYYLTKNMICAGDYMGHDACQGDSGGPLACKLNSTQNKSLVGIVSFGIGCGRPRYPGVYTNVYQFVDWIKEQYTRNSAISLIFNGMYPLEILTTSILYACYNL